MRTLRLSSEPPRVRAGDVRVPQRDPDAGGQQHTKTVSAAVEDESGTFLRCRFIMITHEKVKAPKLVTVSERNLQSAATRLLPRHNRLVSTEVEYLRRVLGEKASQSEIDEKVLLVRRLPWRDICGDV